MSCLTPRLEKCNASNFANNYVLRSLPSRSAVPHSLGKRPLAFKFFNRAVVDIDIHVVFGAGNCVETSGSIYSAAIHLTGELPHCVSLPCAGRKICHAPFEARVPQTRL